MGNAEIIRDQRYRTEPWCRNTDAGLRQLTTGRNADAGLTFLRHSAIPAFTYDLSISYSKNNTISSCLWTFWTFHYLQFGYTFHHHQHWQNVGCRVYPFFKCRNVGLSGIKSVRYRNEQNCRWRNQSGTGMLWYRTDDGMPMPGDANIQRNNNCECLVPIFKDVQKAVWWIILQRGDCKWSEVW
jgi:hypothetical protein